MKKKKILLILGIMFVFFVIFTVASILYTERPEFCLSCHIMKPYYASWKKSTHNKVNCVECHYEPSLKAHVKGKIKGLLEVAKFLTNGYKKKYDAVVTDATCLRAGCHEKAKFENKELLFRKKVAFTHAQHFKMLKTNIELRCTNCHTQLMNDQHMTVEDNQCFICHFKNSSPAKLAGECLKCHSKIKENATHKEALASGSKCTECHNEVVKGEGKVRKEMCYFCHQDRDQIKKVKDSHLMHNIHVKKNKVDCINCHDIIEHQ